MTVSYIRAFLGLCLMLEIMALGGCGASTYKATYTTVALTASVQKAYNTSYQSGTVGKSDEVKMCAVSYSVETISTQIVAAYKAGDTSQVETLTANLATAQAQVETLATSTSKALSVPAKYRGASAEDVIANANISPEAKAGLLKWLEQSRSTRAIGERTRGGEVAIALAVIQYLPQLIQAGTTLYTSVTAEDSEFTYETCTAAIADLTAARIEGMTLAGITLTDLLNQ